MTALPHLFCDPLVGDIIIRTCDGVEFHVHRDILSRESPFFSAMLSLPQAPPGPSDTKPLVEVQEGREPWSDLIPFCYTHVLPTVDNPRKACALLEAGRKYEMTSITDGVHRALLDPAVLAIEPIICYALACAYDLPDVAQAAARHSLKTPIYFEYVEELELISFRDWHRLSQYRKRCSAAARGFLGMGLFAGDPVATLAGSSWLRRRAEHLRCDCGSGARFEEAGGSRARGASVSARCRRTSYRLPSATLGQETFTNVTWNMRESWVTYLRELDHALEMTPDPAIALSATLLDPVVQSAQGCQVCMSTIHQKVKSFTDVVHKEIENAVSKVRRISQCSCYVAV